MLEGDGLIAQYFLFLRIWRKGVIHIFDSSFFDITAECNVMQCNVCWKGMGALLNIFHFSVFEIAELCMVVRGRGFKV